MSNSRSPREVRSITIGISGIAPHPIVRARRLAVLALAAALLAPSAASASTSHAGWPPLQHLVMDKGPAGEQHVLEGRASVHNWLLGGYGNDTIWGGNAGDVIWGDYHPS